MNRLYFGDNLKWLSDRKEFPDASIDLVYLDPPFNSNADYNILFREPSGQVSQAQFRAFTSTRDATATRSDRELDQGRPRLIYGLRNGESYTNSNRSNSTANTGHRCFPLGGSARRADLAHAHVHAKFVYHPTSVPRSRGSQ